MKRETKKDVYARYGIEYKGNKLYCEPLKKWLNPMLPIGTNTKVGDAATWSIYHGNETLTPDMFGEKARAVMENVGVSEIKASCPCHCDGCYCDSGFYCYDSTKAVNLQKLILAKMYPEWLERAIMAQIEADSVKQLRIHAAGDFFSESYVDMWKRIAARFDGVIFWTYTKYEYAVNAFNGLDNLSLVPSCTPAGFNFGTCAELLYKYRKLTSMGYRVHICACGTNMEKHCSDCVHGCKAIGKECDYVLFIKHSTRDYKAGVDDPDEFKAVCEIIRNQAN